MFGNQATSRRRSAPSFGFGSSTRNQAGKVFISREHAKLATSGFSPGPSAYTLRAAVGTQNDGRKRSSPQWVFGSSDRFMQGKKGIQDPGVLHSPLCATHLHQAPSAAHHFPLTRFFFACCVSGPGAYDVKPGLGVQVSSQTHTEPLFGFGTAGREHVAKVYLSEEHNKSLHGCDSPGPSMYTLNAAVGTQQLSKKSNQPKWVFASSNRFQYDHVKRATTSPGPGAYTLNAAVGNQVLSTMHSAATPGFGASTRDQMGKIYISPEHEKAQTGNNSPGPCNYALPEGTGPQPLSKYHSLPAYGFGTAERWMPNKTTSALAPGPGSYCI